MKKPLITSCITLLSLFTTVFFNVSYAADEKPPVFDCTLTDKVSADDEPGPAKVTFSKDTPMIYLVCESDTVKKGQVILSEWIAADTNNVAPPNYKIDQKTIIVPNDYDAGNDTYTSTFSLSKPDNGWPVGSYHVDIHVQDQLVKSEKFSIK